MSDKTPSGVALLASLEGAAQGRGRVTPLSPSPKSSDHPDFDWDAIADIVIEAVQDGEGEVLSHYLKKAFDRYKVVLIDNWTEEDNNK
jgi:hypothetical protein